MGDHVRSVAVLHHLLGFPDFFVVVAFPFHPHSIIVDYGIVYASLYRIAVFCVVCFFWVFFTFVASVFFLQYFDTVGWVF